MAITVNDIADLIHYHLVLSEDCDERADANLAQLAIRIRAMLSSGSLLELGQWLLCDRCGCMVDVDVLAPDGSNFTQDGDFLCSSCLYCEDEEFESRRAK